MKQVLVIWIGGGFGSLLRYWMQLLASKLLAVSFPVGTLIVNISGCFLIGLFYGMLTKSAFTNSDWKLFLVTGLCGGYTTFSSFSYESISLFKEGNYLYFITYIVSSFILGLMATVVGSVIIK